MNESNELKLIDESIAEGEGPTVEFKRVKILSDSIELAKLMVAFANTLGGRILVGVCDDGSIEGMKEKKKHETFIMEIARKRCDPPLIPRFLVIRKHEGAIYLIKVLRYQKYPHAVKTREGRIYFIRVGSTVREASPSELAMLFEARARAGPSAEFLISEIYSPLYEEVKLMRDNISESKPPLKARYGRPNYSAPLPPDKVPGYIRKRMMFTGKYEIVPENLRKMLDKFYGECEEFRVHNQKQGELLSATEDLMEELKKRILNPFK